MASQTSVGGRSLNFLAILDVVGLIPPLRESDAIAKVGLENSRVGSSANPLLPAEDLIPPDE